LIRDISRNSCLILDENSRRGSLDRISMIFSSTSVILVNPSVVRFLKPLNELLEEAIKDLIEKYEVQNELKTAHPTLKTNR
jgi:hypothetical protein